MPTTSIKELLHYFLIPRNPPFLHKKHVLVNDQTINSARSGGRRSLFVADLWWRRLTLFILMGKPELVQELYQDQHLIVNKPGRVWKLIRHRSRPNSSAQSCICLCRDSLCIQTWQGDQWRCSLCQQPFVLLYTNLPETRISSVNTGL